MKNKLITMAVAASMLATGVKANLHIPLDPKIHSNYAEPAKFDGYIVITRAEEYLGTAEFKGPILDSFVDLGADGIAIVDLLELHPVGFLAPKKDDIGVNDGHFLLIN
jgi:hypothetical protein